MSKHTGISGTNGMRSGSIDIRHFHRLDVFAIRYSE